MSITNINPSSDNSIKLDNKELFTNITTSTNKEVEENKSITTTEKDTGVKASAKGNIPTGFSVLGGGDSSVISAEKVIQKYSSCGDTKTLDNINSALSKLSTAKNLDGFGEKDLMALTILGLDAKMDNGKLVVKDKDGNEIKDLSNLISATQNSISRSIAHIQKNDIPEKKMEISQAETDNLVKEAQAMAKTLNEQDVKIETVLKPLSEETNKLIKEFEEIRNFIEGNSKKIETSVGNVKDLKSQAEKLISVSKERPLTMNEKQQLLSIESTIKIKQKELQNIYEGSEILLRQADIVYAQYAEKLPDSEVDTLKGMHSALQKTVQGQSLTARENFLASISEDIYKITSNMSEGELNKALTDTNTRVKMFADVNKVLNKLISTDNYSSITESDKALLWDKLKIKVSNENGKVALYYQDGNKAVKVSKEELRQMQKDLNNIVTSPDLFNFARATGEIIFAYRQQESSQNNNVGNTATTKNISNEKTEVVVNNGSSDNSKTANTVGQEDVTTPITTNTDGSFLAEKMKEKEEEQKYHENKINQIYEHRREVTKQQTEEVIQESINKNRTE